MKIEITRPVKIDIKFLEVHVPIFDCYNDEGLYEDLPKRCGDYWKFVIDIDSGTIIEWDYPEDYKIHLKVCDSGMYNLLDPKGNEVCPEYHYYVPDAIPNGYNDYLDFTILPNGKIKEWDVNEDSFVDFFKDD